MDIWIDLYPFRAVIILTQIQFAMYMTKTDFNNRLSKSQAKQDHSTVYSNMTRLCTLWEHDNKVNLIVPYFEFNTL